MVLEDAMKIYNHNIHIETKKKIEELVNGARQKRVHNTKSWVCVIVFAKWITCIVHRYGRKGGSGVGLGSPLHP
jgi:hypothetical protein